MIIQNGTIEVQIIAEGELDDKGYPIVPVGEQWGEPIPCQYMIAKYNALALLLNEPITEQNYTILIEKQEFSADRVRITDMEGVEVGQFSVTSIEPLDAVGQIRIQV